MTVTDVWRLSQYHKLITSKKEEDGKNGLTIKQFTGVFAKQLNKIAMSCENEADSCESPTMASRSSSISPLKSDIITDYIGRAEYTDAEGRFHEPSLLPMTEQKRGTKNRCHRHCQWRKLKKPEDYSVLYGLVTLMPSPLACQHATTVAVHAFYFMFGTVDNRKQSANAVALRVTIN
jgi:hypothetical protein